MDTYSQDDFEYAENALVTYGQPQQTVQQVSTKVAPAYDGKSSWFSYEEAIDDWCDITELDADK